MFKTWTSKMSEISENGKRTSAVTVKKKTKN